MLSDLLALSPAAAWFLVVAAFGAGVVRGFSGFGTSAVLMAAAAPILPPVAMIPACWMVEAAEKIYYWCTIVEAAAQPWEAGSSVRHTN